MRYVEKPFIPQPSPESRGGFLRLRIWWHRRAANKMHIASLDELELIYRHFKPGTANNSCYTRAGINISAMPPNDPYTPDSPRQTKLKAFHQGGPEAFDLAWYWSSTQHAADAAYAWIQDFDDGDQYNSHKGGTYRARAVRRIKI